ncbi:TonB-dependent receptor domain-containing protein [Sphingomonas crocodyli]|uniref:TonB-dependent receptor n=1 Tax=Sphingomonas crocodyli TaxID=1979270 RepID=A0A437MAU4_9SPHN|nr:TonB-dependent receptor [Sphingomonas crocodyli]RVT94779.1 TonB-dependent receptor [Sphingomonas crocodyli]
MKAWVKSALLASTVLVSTAAAAQTAPVEPAPAPAETSTDDSGVQDIIVTGSRIVRDGYTAPTPVTVAPTADLAKATPTNIADGLNKLPQFSLSSGPARSTHNFASSAANGNLLNLRGVGPERTLIMFDSVRMPPTTFRGVVDVNIIPNLLVERVDIVTAGASAAYGSDAVSGVVNFVLNKKFTGLTGVIQGGVDQRGNNGNEKFGLAYGTDFADDRGHILLSGEYYNSRGMLRSDRVSSRGNYLYAGQNRAALLAGSPGGSAANPFVIYNNTTINNATVGGLINGPAGFSFNNFRFNAQGQAVPFNIGTQIGTPGYSVGGDGYTIPADSTAVAPLRTYQTFGRVSYDVTDDINVYAQGIFTRSDLRYNSLANAFTPPNVATIYSGNPYIPANVQAAMTAQGVGSFTLSDYLSEMGTLKAKERTDFYMGQAGIEGKLGNFSWNLGYVHSESVFKLAQQTFDIKKVYAAIDAVRNPANGQITCRVLLDPTVASQYQGCQPLNILGVGAAAGTMGGYNWANGVSRYRAETKQDQLQGAIQGSLFDLPAGPVDVVIGAEWRRQKLHLTSNSDPATLAGATAAQTTALRNAYFAGLRGVPTTALYYNLTNTGVANGRVTVKEAFAEISVPILKDTPFFEALDVNAAGRITDYSTSGRVETWKVGGTWKPISDVLFRITRSRDIRAPALYDLFAGDSSGIGTLNDPVSGITSNVPQITGGNAALKPEKADTLTFGGVLTPSFLRGFSVSVDYYNLKIDDAIGTLGTAQIVNNCRLDANAPECALVTRPSPTAFPTSVRIAPANIAALKTKGIDIDASYRTALGNGNLSLRAYVNYLDSFKTQQSATQVVLENAGRAATGNQPIARPKWRGTFNVNYENNGWGVFISEQYIGSSKLGFPAATGQNQVFADPKVPVVWYTDMTISKKIDAFGGDIEFFGTVNNLFDKKPPLIPGTIPGLNLPTIISVYDQVGRAFTAGARFKF